jgi:cytochrome P450
MTQDIPGTLLLDPTVLAEPHSFYRRLHREAPVWRVPGRDVIVVSGFDLVEEATKRVEDFSSNIRFLLFRDDEGLPARLPFGDSTIQTLATADPPVHGVHKRTVFPEFVAKRMTLIEPEVSKIAAACVDDALVMGDLDFMAQVGNRVPITVISGLIGFRDAEIASLLQAAFDGVAMLAATLPLADIQAIMMRGSDVTAWIYGQLMAAADAPGDDILTSISRGVEHGSLNTAEAVVILQTMLSAGGESTTSLLGSAVRMLADDQALQQRLREHPELTPAFIEEAARLEPPFRNHMRSVIRDTELGGVEIPAGSTALMFWGAANRDAAQFERPDEIMLDRPRRHVTFGHGIHQCVGAPLARLEARVVINTLLARTHHFSVDADDRPEWVNSLMVRRYDRLPLRLVAR